MSFSLMHGTFWLCSIPPEWSHWLNYMSDDIPTKGDMSGERPMYFVTREAFVTGERPYMLPKGSWLNPEKVSHMAIPTLLPFS